LSFIRYYNSESTQAKWLHGIGLSTNYPLWIKAASPSVSAFYASLPRRFLHRKACEFFVDTDPQEVARYPVVEEDIEYK
jgi:hypothetical protein